MQINSSHKIKHKIYQHKYSASKFMNKGKNKQIVKMLMKKTLIKKMLMKKTLIKKMF